MPRGPHWVRRAYYPTGYHLLLRDLSREVPIGGAIAWIRQAGCARYRQAPTASPRGCRAG